jgi:hypothetical protein
MPKVNAEEYTFDGLKHPVGGAASDPGQCPSLCYLVGLTDSPTHKISDALVAKRILGWLYEFEEQALNAEHLKAGEEFFSRYFEAGYHPQTPCMVVKQWSPISAMLERGFEPRVLKRETKWRAAASGIWEPPTLSGILEITSARTVEELFWAIVAKAASRAIERHGWISIIAKPGYDYDSAVGSLPTWPVEEVARAGRVLWQRTPAG